MCIERVALIREKNNLRSYSWLVVCVGVILIQIQSWNSLFSSLIHSDFFLTTVCVIQMCVFNRWKINGRQVAILCFEQKSTSTKTTDTMLFSWHKIAWWTFEIRYRLETKIKCDFQTNTKKNNLMWNNR